MAPHESPSTPQRRAAATARLLLMLAGFGIAWSWTAGPAAARQITPTVPAFDAAAAPPGTVVRSLTQRVRPGGNAGNAE